MVAPRAYWKGYLKLSLVSCPVALFPASSERDKISFNQINKKTGNRIRYRKVDAETGEVGEQAFAVIREAIRKEGMVALGRVVFTSREHVITLEPRGKGLIGFTLRYPYEVRKEDEYFEDIPDEKIPKDMLELASHIVETKSGHFEPEKFEDHYEDALKELLKKKQAGEKIEAPKSEHQRKSST
jgi:non-homologous end joining protein Ku